MLRSILLMAVVQGLLLASVFAQVEGKLAQIAGYVSEADSVKPIPFATIRIASTPFGCAADINGFFALPARPGDTLRVSAVGYSERRLILPDSMPDNRYLVYLELSADTILLPETTILPWPSREQFKQAFVEADVPDDDLERARKNLPEATLRAAARNADMDASMVFRQTVDDHMRRSYYAGQTTPLTIFDVGAWYRFIKAVRQGKLKNPDKTK